MKIAIDYRMHRHTGIGTYLRNLLGKLAQLGEGHSFHLVVNPGDSPDLRSGMGNCRLFELSARAPVYSIREQVLLGMALTRMRPDVFHAPHFNAALFHPVPTVVTFHDLIYLKFPQNIPTVLGRLYAHGMFRAAVWRATRILTVSQHTANDVADSLGADQEKIRVTLEGVPSGVPAGEHEKRSLPPLPAAIDRPYLLYVGLQAPHKNLVRLMEAFAENDHLSRNYQLVLAGKQDPRWSRSVPPRYRDGSSRCIVYTGWVGDDVLESLYAHSRGFVLPSLYEGFGLPVLEAMARGIPVACSNAASLPEVAGNAALMFDPTSIADIRSALHRLLDDDSLRTHLVRAGLEQVRKFSWTECARLTLRAYEEACGESSIVDIGLS